MGFNLHFQISNVMKLLTIVKDGRSLVLKEGDVFVALGEPKLYPWGYYSDKVYGFRIKKINNGGGVKKILRD